MTTGNIRWDISIDNDYKGYDVHLLRNGSQTGDLRELKMRNPRATQPMQFIATFTTSVFHMRHGIKL